MLLLKIHMKYVHHHAIVVYLNVMDKAAHERRLIKNPKEFELHWRQHWSETGFCVRLSEWVENDDDRWGITHLRSTEIIFDQWNEILVLRNIPITIIIIIIIIIIIGNDLASASSEFSFSFSMFYAKDYNK